ncbi:unnamed protein product [Lactuca virosa]|uniref:Uncharacterized protein n=1 Tax=Lactuca virosa TaxID=75947 RepID=A0AAU9NT01_9ASTR|nr:unnamed protein product [Lactuca virosa]
MAPPGPLRDPPLIIDLDPSTHHPLRTNLIDGSKYGISATTKTSLFFDATTIASSPSSGAASTTTNIVSAPLYSVRDVLTTIFLVISPFNFLWSCISDQPPHSLPIAKGRYTNSSRVIYIPIPFALCIQIPNPRLPSASLPYPQTTATAHLRSGKSCWRCSPASGGVAPVPDTINK